MIVRVPVMIGEKEQILAIKLAKLLIMWSSLVRDWSCNYIIGGLSDLLAQVDQADLVKLAQIVLALPLELLLI